MEDDGARRSEEERQQVEQILNAPCRNEMKHYYSGLTGEETITLCRLRIVGMMIEGGRVESGDEGTRVSVWWGQELGDRREGRETNECRDGLAGLA